MLENIIQYRFQEGEGAWDVKAGNYELFKARNNAEVLSTDIRLLPGIEITMAIIVSRQTYTDETCSISRCGSTETTPTVSGGRVW
jgi:hypothetical protein